MAKQLTATAPSLSLAVHHLQQALDAAMVEGLGADRRLTPRQVVVLQAIDRAKGGSQTALVDMTGIDRSTIADIVRRLQKNKLIARKRTKLDARAYAVTLTDEGQAVVSRASKAVAAIEAKAVKVAGRGAVDALVRLEQALRK